MVATRTFDGGTLTPCPRCGVDDWESQDDQTHDGGSCEVFRCRACGYRLHLELPD